MSSFVIRAFVCAFACCVAVKSTDAQTCPGGQPQQTVSYNTYAIGNGNQTTTVSQFDPSIGTLYSVTFNANIFFNFKYTLSNSSSSVQDKTVNVRRRDLLGATSPTNTTPIQLLPTAWYEQNFEHDELMGTGVPPGSSDYSYSIYNPKVVSTTFDQNVVPFMGSDSLYLKYTTITQDAMGYGSSDVNMTAKTVYDSIVFSVTYSYCPATSLPSKSINLRSSVQSDKILIGWSSDDNLFEGTYEILKSIDGRTYMSINRQSISPQKQNNYTFLYKPTAQDPGKGFFRIKQTDKYGNVTYSRVLTVALPSAGPDYTPVTEKSILIYPTLVTDNQININIPEAGAKDEWQIRIISLSGQVMQQTRFINTNLAKVTLPSNMPAGMYIVNAYNTRTQANFREKIIVNR